MPRKITVRNKQHPHNQMMEAGQKAKAAMRAKSNAELDAFLAENIQQDEVRDRVLGLTRAAKIAYVVRATKMAFVEDYKSRQEADTAQEN